MFKVLTDGCEPTRGSKYSSCVDLYASEDVVIGAGETKIVPLGVMIDLELLYGQILKQHDNDMDFCNEAYYREFLLYNCLELKPRSSLTLPPQKDKPERKGLIIANGVGEVDLDYTDEIGIILHNPVSLKSVDIGIRTTIMRHEMTKENFSEKEIETTQKEFMTPRIGLFQTVIKKGERIAQIKLVEHKSYLFDIKSEDERTGGYGSTNKEDVHISSMPDNENLVAHRVPEPIY